MYDGTWWVHEKSYNRARWLDTGTGRFLAIDRAEGVDAIPTTFHAYLYATQDPVNKKDPTGFYAVSTGDLLGAQLGQQSLQAASMASRFSLGHRVVAGAILAGGLVSAVAGPVGELQQQTPNIVYRGGKHTLSGGEHSGQVRSKTYTPRLKDIDGLSTFDRIEMAAEPGEIAQIIDVRKLITLKTHARPTIWRGYRGVHVAIFHPNPEMHTDWASNYERNDNVLHSLSIELINARIGEQMRPPSDGREPPKDGRW